MKISHEAVIRKESEGGGEGVVYARFRRTMALSSFRGNDQGAAQPSENRSVREAKDGELR